MKLISNKSHLLVTTCLSSCEIHHQEVELHIKIVVLEQTNSRQDTLDSLLKLLLGKAIMHYHLNCLKWWKGLTKAIFRRIHQARVFYTPQVVNYANFTIYKSKTQQLINLSGPLLK